MLAVLFKVSWTQDWRKNKKCRCFIFNLENKKMVLKNRNPGFNVL